MIAPKTKFDNVQSLVDAGVKTSINVAKGIDEKFDIVTKATAVKDKVKEMAKPSMMTLVGIARDMVPDGQCPALWLQSSSLGRSTEQQRGHGCLSSVCESQGC